MRHKKFYFQKEAVGNGDLGELMETSSKWGFFLMSVPYDGGGEVKETPYIDWHDEHGAEVMNGSESLKLKDYDLTLKFGYKGNDTSSLLSSMRSFRNYLLGTNGDGRLTRIFNEQTGVGRGGVQLKKIDPEPTYYHGSQGVRLFFNVTLHVNNPYDYYILNNGNITNV